MAIGTNPRFIDIGSSHRDLIFDHAWQRNANWAVPLELTHDLCNHFTNCLGCGRFRGGNFHALRYELTRIQINNCTFDTGTTDVNTHA